jgi:SAM-dependent methyltransferase
MTTNYNDIADDYQKTKEHPVKNYCEAFTFVQVLGDMAAKSALDLACGDGFYKRLIKQHGAAEVIGVDLSEHMVNNARVIEEADPLGIEYRIGGATKLGIEYRVQDVADLERMGRFDIALAVYLFPYATTRRQFSSTCRSIHRNLKPGGKLVAATFNPAVAEAELPGYRPYGVNLTTPTGLHDGAVIIASLDIPNGSVDLTAHYWSQETYEHTLTETGFQTITWHPMQVPDEALQLYGRDYWQTYQRKSLDIVLACYKI